MSDVSEVTEWCYDIYKLAETLTDSLCCVCPRSLAHCLALLQVSLVLVAVMLLLLLLCVAVVLLLLLLVPGVPIAGDDVTLPDLVPLAPHPCRRLLLLLDGDRGSGHVLQQEMY